jgi:hypothetical protein
MKHFAMLVLMMFCSFQAHSQTTSGGCTNSSLNGTYFYLLTGEVTSGFSPYAELGKLVLDGQGGVSGQSKASIGGVLRSSSLPGSYAVMGNCIGTMNLSVNSQAGIAFDFQIVAGGHGALIAFASSGGVLTGRAYRSSGQCGNQSLASTYAYGLAGVVPATYGTVEFSDVGQTSFDGRGGLTVASRANIGNGPFSVNGTGAYSVASDCGGIAQVTAQSSVMNYVIAVVEGRGVLFLETDGGTTVSGFADPQLVQVVLPQFVFGGGWYSALYFTNTNNSSVSFALSFMGDNGTALSVPSVGGTSTNISVAPHGTTVIEAPNIDSLNQGYVSLGLPVGVVGYGIFRQSVPGNPDQEAVVPFSGATATSSTLAWDETAFTTRIAIVNPSSIAATIAITVSDTNGTVVGTSSVNLPPYNKMEAPLRNLPRLAGMVGKRGSAQFTASTGSVAVLGLRFGASAFTSIPTTQQ